MTADTESTPPDDGERFRLATEAMRGLVYDWDSQGDGVFYSAGVADLLGDGAMDFPATCASWRQRIHPDDRARMEANFAAAQASQAPVFDSEYRVRHSNGHYVWVWDHARCVYGDDGTLRRIVGCTVSIDDRKRAQAALVESEQRFRTLADDLPMLVWLHDDQGQQEFVNETYCEYFGVTRDALLDDPLHLLPHVDDGVDHVEEFMACVRERRPFHREIRARRGDGQWRWLDSRGRPRFGPDGVYLGHVGISADITDRRRAEQALRDSEVAERRARERAQLLAEMMAELEVVDGVGARAQRLVDLLVPRVADYATVEIPGSTQPVVALAHRDRRDLRVLRELRQRHRLTADDAHSVWRAAAGEQQLISEISPVLRTEYALDAETAALLEQLGPRSHIAVPMSVGQRQAGVLLLGLSDPGRRLYTDGDLAFAREIADRAGVLLASARVQAEAREVGLRLQRALLPEAVLAHPDVAIAASYEAGSERLEVGGDWYDTIGLSDGRVGLAVGDVVGHGIDAAASMGRLRTALAALAPYTASPAQVLTQLDEFARSPNGTDFATACYAILDPASGTLRYASAGHPPMLLVSPDGTSRWLEGGRSMPLCVPDSDPRPEATVHLEPGALLVGYSDGLVERRRERLSTGLARLERAAVTLRDAPVDLLCEQLVTEMTAASVPEDDVVVLCVRLAAAATRRFHRVFPAHPVELAPMRAAVREWLAAHNVEVRRDIDVLLPLGEACANAVEHAYHGRAPGEVEVEITGDSDDQLVVRVRDFGRWRSSAHADGHRGRGTAIMRAASAEFERSSDAAGTTVTFRVALDGQERRVGRDRLARRNGHGGQERRHGRDGRDRLDRRGGRDGRDGRDR